MKIKVENLGYIKQGEVDLDHDLIVFCGKNNTGKTYFSYFIYEIGKERRFFNIESKDLVSQKSREDGFVKITINSLSYIDNNEKLFEVASKIKESIKSNFDKKTPFYSNKNFEFDIIPDERDYYISRLKKLEYDRTSRLSKEDGRDVMSYCNKLKDSFDIEIRLSVEDLISEDEELLEDDLFEVDLFSKIHLRAVMDKVLMPNFTSTKFFPAERLAIDTFSKEISLNRLNDDPLLKYSQQRYNRILTDNIRLAQDLTNLSKRNGKFSYLAEALEQEISGKIVTSDLGELQFSPSYLEGENLSMQFSSSSVKSLASVIFYFRHIATSGSTIIIDEPELNLHPDLQRKFARVLVKAANAGIKVIISTHSDHIIREINNMVMLSQDSESAKALRKEYDYTNDQVIKPSQIGTYIFAENTIKSQTVSETGIEVESIDKEINDLNNSSVHIFSTLYDN